MQTASNPTADHLLAHVAWIRGLAGHLCTDAHLAEDVAQEACVAALEQPPHNGARVRQWLASVMRNAVRQNARGERRREEREHAAARHESIASSAELVGQVAMQRELVEAVLGLDEPYRRTVILRFFEELPPREIAREAGVPVATVYSRLNRALERLREVLDDGHGGDRRAWVAVFLPLADQAHMSSAASIGALAVNAKVIAVVSGLAAVGVLAAISPFGDDGEKPLDDGAALVELEAGGALAGTRGGGGLEVNPSVEAREGILAAGPSSTQAPAAVEQPEAAPTWTVRGRVLDSDAQPVAEVPIGIPGAAELGRSGAGGRFELEVTAERGSLAALSDDWVTVREGVWRPESAIDLTVVIARSIDVGGRVIDTEGRELPGAFMHLVLPRDFDARFEDRMDASRTMNWRGHTGTDGRFLFEGVPAVADARVQAALEGYAFAEVDAPSATDHGVEIVLVRPETPEEGVIHGVVVREDGSPAPGARVALGLTSTACDAEGRFEIQLARAVTANRMVAVEGERLPAILDRPMEPDEGLAGWPDHVELRLGGPPLSIAGRVVDAEGEAIVGIDVWVVDTTRFGNIGRMPASVEGLASGAMIPPQAIQSALQLPAQDGDDYWDYTSAAPPPTALWNYATTDEEGRFRIGGLLDRRYELKVMDRRSLRSFVTKEYRAGRDDLRIQMPGAGFHERLGGRVVGPDGRPIEGVRVGLETFAFEVGGRVFGGRMDLGLVRSRESVQTDADGLFEFRDVPRKGVYLSLFSDRIVPSRFEPDEVADPLALEVPVEVRCHLRVELLDLSEGVDGISIHDGEGQTLDLIIVRGESVNAYDVVPLQDGRTEVLSSSSAARTLVLLRGRETVREVVISLSTDEINLIQP